MSDSTIRASPNPARSVLPDNSELWDCIKVDAFKALVHAWTEVSPPSNRRKPQLAQTLLDEKASIDWDRVFGWYNARLPDPGAEPADGVNSREWAFDRTFHLLMMRERIKTVPLLAIQELDLARFDDTLTNEDQETPPRDAEFPKPPTNSQLDPSLLQGAEAPSSREAASGIGAGAGGQSSHATEPNFPVPPRHDVPTSPSSSLTTMLEEQSPAPGPVEPASLVIPPTSPRVDSSTVRPDMHNSGEQGACVPHDLPAGEAAQTTPTDALTPHTAGAATGPPETAPSAGEVAIFPAESGPSVDGPSFPVDRPQTAGTLPPHALIPMSPAESDPYWPLFSRALQISAFVRMDGSAPQCDAIGLPTFDNGVLTTTGKIALYGSDRRPGADLSHDMDILSIMEDAPLSFRPGTPTVTVSSTHLLQAFMRDPRFLDGNMIFTVPLGLGTSSDYAIGHIMGDHVAVQGPPVEVPLFTLGPHSPTFMYQGILFASTFQVKSIPVVGALHSHDQERGSDSEETRRPNKRRTKKPKQAQPTFSSEESNLALAEWLGETDGGAWAQDDVVGKIQGADMNKNYPFIVLLTWVDMVRQLSELGPPDHTAPPAARMKKMTNIAVGHFLGKSIGWIQGVQRIAQLLHVYAEDAHVIKFLKTAKEDAGGMRTLEKALRQVIEVPEVPSASSLAVDAGPSRKGKASASSLAPDASRKGKSSASTPASAPAAGPSRKRNPSAPNVARPSRATTTLGSSSQKLKKRPRSKEDDEESVGRPIEPDYDSMTYVDWDALQESQ